MTDSSFLGFSSDDVAVVTGAASGIGRAVAVSLLAEGVAVAAWDLSAKRLQTLATELEVPTSRLRVGCVDVRDRAAVAAALGDCERHLGKAGLLVNNAGPPSSTPFPFHEGVEASLGSVHCMTEAWLATDGSKGGTLVNVASVSGALMGEGPTPWYVAAKAGIAGYTRYLAVTRPGGIRANAVAPGIVETPRTRELLESESGQAVIARNPMGRAAQPSEVSAAVVFLLSPASAHINGVLLPVDGGTLMTQ